ncbi:MAG: efflux RND transporter permease subunit [Raineya sp.]|nr:efflux RND transporter permease subunit [Raineya sp.]MDW8296115.1 efflux RND transporter permease subunit [Raineya sp.]
MSNSSQAFFKKHIRLRNHWGRFVEYILRFRLPILLIILGITGLMAYWGSQVTMKYEFVPVIPKDDPDMVNFRRFKQTFGEDGNVFIIGFNDKRIYELAYFQKYYQLCEKLGKIEGVRQVLSLAVLKEILKDDSAKRFYSRPIFAQMPRSQAELDSGLVKIRSIKLYEGQIFNRNNNATILGITIEKSYLNSAKRLKLTPQIIALAEQFEKETGIKVHFGGLPYVRSITTGKVKDELQFFLAISVLVTSLVILFFFRSWQPLLVTLAVITCAVLWALGVMHLFGFQITGLTGLLPPLLVVIAVPNCVYLINKYQQEYLKIQNQRQAILQMLRELGLVTIIANLTTAAGFAVFAFGNVDLLSEFGLVMSLSILATFVISICLVPIIYSYLPAPSVKTTKHLEIRYIKSFLNFLVKVALKHKKWVYAINFWVIVLGLWGMSKLRPLAYLVDDLPESSGVRADLRFFEQNFKGVMPLEVVIDTKKPKGLRKRGIIEKADSLETELTKLKEIGKPLSIVAYLKSANQVYFNGDTNFYALPDSRNWIFFQQYVRQRPDGTDNLSQFFVDSLEQKMRISFKAADMGSIRVRELLETQIYPTINKIFGKTNVEVQVTGSVPIFAKSNRYLIDNLLNSILIAIVLVALANSLIFTNLRLIIISLIPNVIPMIATAGLMGFLGIPLKPSTMILFSIILGIAIDDTIHFLAHYRMQLDKDPDHIHAIITSLKETGFSMIYTSVVLMAGFGIFTLSEFQGTFFLGLLSATTLLVAMLTNLTILPALLMNFDEQRQKKPNEDYIQESEQEAEV